MSDLSPSNLRDRWMLVALMLIYAALLFRPNPTRAEDASKCDRTDSAEFWSPDARWVVRRYGNICDLGIMSSAAVKLDLALATSPNSSVTILSVDMPSDKLQWPKPEWESSKKIVIQLPSSANIALQVASFQNIEIQLRFCPGDPANRDRWVAYKAAYHQWVVDMAAWSRLQNQDPHTAGPKPVSPTPPEGRQPDASCVR